MEEEDLTLSEILTALTDFITQDGAISEEQRAFYKAFRVHLNNQAGPFSIGDIETLLLKTKEEISEISEEEFGNMGEAILSQYNTKNKEAINERIRRLAEEEAAERALAEEERKRLEEERQALQKKNQA